MSTLYLVCLIVGGFFVALSIFGGDAEADLDFDADADIDAGGDYDPGDVGVGAGQGLIDLFTIRALFLFMAFFGLTGVLLDWAGTGEPFTAVLSALTGTVVGLGGNYLIQRIGYQTVSSNVTDRDLEGRTARVTLPFEGAQKGKIQLELRGKDVHMMARGLGRDEAPEAFEEGDTVVVVRVVGTVADVVKPE